MQNDGQTQPRSQLAITLKALRIERDWSQKALAKRASLGINTVVRTEADAINPRTGKVDKPKPETLRKLAIALGDGNGERARHAERQLYAAAGYNVQEIVPERDRAQEIAELRALVHAHEQQIAELWRKGSQDARPDIEDYLRRLLSAFPSQEQSDAVRLIRETLEKLESDVRL